MGTDPFSPIAPARVRVLVLPVGRIKSRRFHSFATRLQAVTSVKLKDVTPDVRSGRAIFSPTVCPEGRIYLDVTTSIPQSSFAELAPFELYRNVMILLGTVDVTEYEQASDREEQLVEDGSRNVFYQRAHDSFVSTMENVQEQYPGVLLTQLVVMDSDPAGDKPWIPEGSLHVPPMDQSDDSAIYSLFGSILGTFLGELSVYAEQVRSWATVATPLSMQAPTQRFDLERRPTYNRRASDRSHMSREESPIDGHNDASPRPTSQSFNSPDPSVVNSPRPASPSLQSEAHSSPDLSNGDVQMNTTPENLWKVRAKYASTQSDKASGRSLYPASNTAISSDKEKNIGKARVGIVMGSLYMMAGRWPDAWRELLEHTSKSRTHSDYIWLASGLERIICCMLLLGSEGIGFQIPAFCYMGQDKQSTLYFIEAARDLNTITTVGDVGLATASLRKLGGSIGEVVNTLLHHYDRAGFSTGEALPQVSYSEMVLRLAKLQAFVGIRAPTSTDELFQQGRLDALRRPVGSKEPSDLTRLSISEIVLRAYPGPFADISSPSRCGVLAGIAAVLASLKMDRKRALVLKDLITLIVPSLQHARTLGAAELGIHPSSSLSYAIGDLKLSTPDGDGTSVRQLLQTLSDVYITSVAADDKHEDQVLESSYAELVRRITKAAARTADLDELGSLNLKIDILRSSIEFCESVQDLSGIAQNAALLLRIAGPQGSIDPTVDSRHVWLANEEQVRLANHLMAAVGGAREAGYQIEEPPYWDDFLVRSVQLVDDPTSGRLIEHSKADIPSTERGPFLHDAWGKKPEATREENLIVAGETVYLGVVLQNPYDYEIEIDSITMCTGNGEIHVEQPVATLGPARLEEVVCRARVADPGDVTIVGCKIKMGGCRERVFPIYNDEWAASRRVKVKEATREVSLRPDSDDDDDDATRWPPASQITLTAIPSQPQLVAEACSLTEQSLMVLEGETQKFELTFRNTSSISVDFLRLSFEDALIASLRGAATSKGLSRADLFEVEMSLSKEAFFHAARIDAPDSQSIEPGCTAMFEISITGRAGIRDVKVLVDFARLGTVETEASERFFTRQLAVPINVTVHPALQVHHFEVTGLPLDTVPRASTESTQTQPDINDHAREPATNGSIEARQRSYCLVVLDVRNVWTNPASVEFAVSQSIQPSGDSSKSQVYSQLILSGQSYRFAIPMQKMYVQRAHARIPWLSAQSRRQFVVSAIGESPGQEASARELFWYREELLKNLQCRWQEQGTSRSGCLNLRSIRMGHRVVEALKFEDVVIEVDVLQAEDTKDKHVRRNGRSSFDVKKEAFLTLRTRLHNLSDRTLSTVLRLQPSIPSQTQDLTPDAVLRRFLWSGLLQKPLPPLQPGDTQTIDLGVCIVADGLYEIGAVLEEITPSIPTSEKTATDGNDDDDLDEAKYQSSSERRLWKTSEPCVIRVQGDF